YSHSFRAFRDLSSFPTRRSSDLFSSPSVSARSTVGATACAPGSVVISGTLSASASLVIVIIAISTNTFGLLVHLICCSQAVNSRSEEHTSELQSRFDLVCRLLLE